MNGIPEHCSLVTQSVFRVEAYNRLHHFVFTRAFFLVLSGGSMIERQLRFFLSYLSACKRRALGKLNAKWIQYSESFYTLQNQCNKTSFWMFYLCCVDAVQPNYVTSQSTVKSPASECARLSLQIKVVLGKLYVTQYNVRFCRL